MGTITYEQFVEWCNRWGYSIEEGFKAMCFTANIVDQKCRNCIDYAIEEHSEAFKQFAEKERDDAVLLLKIYSQLEIQVFNMLEMHEKEVQGK